MAQTQQVAQQQVQSADEALGQIITNAMAVNPVEGSVATPSMEVAKPKRKAATRSKVKNVTAKVNDLLEAQKALREQQKAVKAQLESLKEEAKAGKNNAHVTVSQKEVITDLEGMVALYSKVMRITFTKAHRAVIRFREDAQAFRIAVGADRWNKAGFWRYVGYVDVESLKKQA